MDMMNRGGPRVLEPPFKSWLQTYCHRIRHKHYASVDDEGDSCDGEQRHLDG